MRDTATQAEISRLNESENTFETGDRLVEVYRPVWFPNGSVALFEMYTSYDSVGARSSQLWRGFAGVTLSSLILLLVLVAPIVWHLISRLRGAERQRAALLERSVEASADERRLIAATLHDGPVRSSRRPRSPSPVPPPGRASGTAAWPTTSTQRLRRSGRASVRCAPCSSTSTRRAWPGPDWPPRLPTSPRGSAAATSPSSSTSPLTPS